MLPEASDLRSSWCAGCVASELCFTRGLLVWWTVFWLVVFDRKMFSCRLCFCRSPSWLVGAIWNAPDCCCWWQWIWLDLDEWKTTHVSFSLIEFVEFLLIVCVWFVSEMFWNWCMAVEELFCPWKIRVRNWFFSFL